MKFFENLKIDEVMMNMDQAKKSVKRDFFTHLELHHLYHYKSKNVKSKNVTFLDSSEAAIATLRASNRNFSQILLVNITIIVLKKKTDKI